MERRVFAARGFSSLDRLEKWIAIAGIAVLSVIAVAGFALAIYAAVLFHGMPDASDLADYRPPTATRVYAWDGTLIGEFSKERRIFVPYDQIPPKLAEAFLAAEDHNFFKHQGIDVEGMGRAATRDMWNMLQGKRFEGGSTITQQVAKNVLLGNQVTLGRKLKEAILARRLEQTLSKEQILELYLNEIWLGYRSYGVAAAAYNYFGKSLGDLDLAEMAFLAALPKGPDNYHPIRFKQRAIERRNWIIGQMQELGWVSRAEAQAAIAEDLKVQGAPTRAKYRDADYFVEEVRQEALATMGQKLTEGGYYMRTTLDPQLQTIARTSLMKGLEVYDHRHGWRGAWGHVDGSLDDWEARARSINQPSERRAWRRAVVEEASGGQVRIRLAGGGFGFLTSEDVTWAKAGRGLNRGDLIFVEPAGEAGYNLRQIPQVNGALVAIEPNSGRVLALVGGYSFSLSNFNRATQANRQPGSAFKPFVYATALENGYTPASEVLDAPIELRGASPDEVWKPKNYEDKYLGMTSLRRGLMLSRNTMTVRLAQSIGMSKIRQTAINAGVVNDMAPVLAMALGAGETTPYKLTAAYSAFINGGRRISPHLIELVQDREGKTVFRSDTRDCPGCDAPFGGEDPPTLPDTGKQLFDPITAYQMTSMMQDVVAHGTAYQAAILGPNFGGKTGTTNEFRSAWFVGFDPNIVVGVFVGFDDNRSLGDKETGAVAAVPIFIDFMQQAIKVRPVGDFRPPPKDAKFLLVNGSREAFRNGTQPGDATPDPNAQAPIPNAPPGLPVPVPTNQPAAPPPKQPQDVSGLF
jgi:penicillin-binding protein 1A